MINNKTILAIIPARGGSKGVPRKNIKKLAGKPLIAWTIEEAKKSKYIDRLIVSSEDKEIINVAKQYRCEVPFVRPKELALDDTPGIDPILHALEQFPSYDYIVLLQPTSPLRTVNDIDNAIETAIENNGIAVVSVTVSENTPYWMFKLDKNNKMKSFLENNKLPIRRQDLSKAYMLNGAIYVSGTEKLIQQRAFIQSETIAYIMPKERSYDIDSELDFKMCELLLSEK
ncbi:acylneuraminate cytidylyltransferase family protein [Virgibacillus sp. W0430]|uniref:acylneuraminate cytidylyltransferase family protein n=1 Tax=Virgibacillus sp. W0430 TaxID=3391580 RepID=UPI003F446DE9